MKTLIVAATVLCAGAAFASAQSVDASWRHPDGLFTLQPSVAGAQALLPTAQDDLADFGLGAPEKVRLCSVRQSSIPSAGPVSQALLNQRMAMIATMSAGNQAPDMTITDRRSFDRDGTTVASYRTASPQVVMHEWMFAIATPTGAVLEKIHCAGAPPVTAAEEAQFDVFLNTLHFPTTNGTP